MFNKLYGIFSRTSCAHMYSHNNIISPFLQFIKTSHIAITLPSTLWVINVFLEVYIMVSCVDCFVLFW